MKKKKVLTVFMLMAFISTHSAHANVSITQKLLMPVVELKCKSELNDSKTWKVATFLMSSTKQEKLQKNICGCVSKHAMDDMTAKDVIKATISDEAKDKLVSEAVKNSLKGCATQFVK